MVILNFTFLGRVMYMVNNEIAYGIKPIILFDDSITIYEILVRQLRNKVYPAIKNPQIRMVLIVDFWVDLAYLLRFILIYKRL